MFFCKPVHRLAWAPDERHKHYQNNSCSRKLHEG